MYENLDGIQMANFQFIMKSIINFLPLTAQKIAWLMNKKSANEFPLPSSVELR